MPESINPATGQRLASWPFMTDNQLLAALERAGNAAPAWAGASFKARAHVLRAVAAGLRRESAKLAWAITQEMGKPIVEAEAEIEKSAWNCEYVAEHGERWLTDDVIATNAALSYVSYLPLGTILAILPWNFPVWQIFRCAAGALMAGNTILLKHAPNVLGCADLVTRLLEQSGVPPGVFEHLNVPVTKIPGIIADPRVAAVTLTGSPAAGAAVAAQAGAVCKKSILELGGSDAFIVLEDADIDAAVAAAVRARFTNNGQVCLAAKRFIVAEPIAEEFEARLTAAASRLVCGDPLDRNTQLGPLAREDLRTRLDEQVRASIDAGAKVMLRGGPQSGPGFFYRPTVLADVTPQMRVFTEETFGPVVALSRARDAEQACVLASASTYGLAAMIWTRDTEKARQLARRLAVGSVFINGVTASDPRLPVGGVKLSGYGRELGAAGMRELVNFQTVWIGPPQP